MRLPRHDTSLSLSGEEPHEALAADMALLEHVRDQPLLRWYVVNRPAVVLGLALHHRREQVVDAERCRRAGVEVLERAAGGGAVLLDDGMLCAAVCVPNAEADLTESYRWLGQHFAARLGLRRVEVAEARADVVSLRGSPLLSTCYGALSPHELVNAAGAKVVGFAQVRRRHAALFQVGILLRDQSGLADFLQVEDREALRRELHRKSAGLEWQASLPQLVDRIDLQELLQTTREPRVPGEPG